eukprot:TRINITY_DN18246_c0_g1_i1.p1 TRINITY_DN18246_c0_g1~~TRINITY_DN18246_c0_g1_i1.p1  ORF type:complete len:299 (+),score=59.89 TRINITY_DN18246_c0_g1_i1:89-985(+)
MEFENVGRLIESQQELIQSVIREQDRLREEVETIRACLRDSGAVNDRSFLMELMRRRREVTSPSKAETPSLVAVGISRESPVSLGFDGSSPSSVQNVPENPECPPGGARVCGSTACGGGDVDACNGDFSVSPPASAGAASSQLGGGSHRLFRDPRLEVVATDVTGSNRRQQEFTFGKRQFVDRACTSEIPLDCLGSLKLDAGAFSPRRRMDYALRTSSQSPGIHGDVSTVLHPSRHRAETQRGDSIVDAASNDLDQRSKSVEIAARLVSDENRDMESRMLAVYRASFSAKLRDLDVAR